MTGAHDGRNKKFYICVEVPYTLWKVAEASSIEEARKIAEQLEPTDFDNFDYFYEWLGNNWNEFAGKIEIEEINE